MYPTIWKSELTTLLICPNHVKKIVYLSHPRQLVVFVKPNKICLFSPCIILKININVYHIQHGYVLDYIMYCVYITGTSGLVSILCINIDKLDYQYYFNGGVLILYRTGISCTSFH